MPTVDSTETIASRGIGQEDYLVLSRDITTDDDSISDTIDIDSDDNDTIEFDAADWGVGYDFYCDTICIEIYDHTNKMLQADYQGLLLVIQENPDSVTRAPDATTIMWREQLGGAMTKAIRASTAVRYIYHSIQLPMKRISKDGCLQIIIYNWSNDDVTIKVSVNGKVM